MYTSPDQILYQDSMKILFTHFTGTKTTTDPRVCLPLEIKIKMSEASVMTRENQQYGRIFTAGLDQFPTKTLEISTEIV